jgi:restriction system protein
MAKRKQKKVNLIDEIIVPLMVIISIFTFVYTNSWKLALLVFMSMFVSTHIIIQLVNERKKKLLKRSGIASIDTMDGFQFEEYLALLFKAHGYKTKVTKGRGDFGADLILHKDGNTIVAQAKRYSKNVGIQAVQEVSSSMKHYKANKSIVITNSYFTKSAIELAKSNDVDLIDRDKLIKMLQVMNPNGEAVDPVQVKLKHAPTCKSCKKEMVLRKSKQGNFYGCVNFPSCKETKSI